MARSESETYPLTLHDALPISLANKPKQRRAGRLRKKGVSGLKQRPVVVVKRKNNDWPNWKPSAAKPKPKPDSGPRKNSGLALGLRPCARWRPNSSNGLTRQKPVFVLKRKPPRKL